jgi:hypothetical protein
MGTAGKHRRRLLFTMSLEARLLNTSNVSVTLQHLFVGFIPIHLPPCSSAILPVPPQTTNYLPIVLSCTTFLYSRSRAMVLGKLETKLIRPPPNLLKPKEEILDIIDI